jgi:hypothetical protein
VEICGMHFGVFSLYIQIYPWGGDDEIFGQLAMASFIRLRNLDDLLWSCLRVIQGIPVLASPRRLSSLDVCIETGAVHWLVSDI